MSSGFYFQESDEIAFDMQFVSFVFVKKYVPNFFSFQPHITKQKGKSAQQICSERQILDNLDPVLCVFSHLRFFDAYGRLDVSSRKFKTILILKDYFSL